MNPDLDRLQPYPFERLAALKGGAETESDAPHIALSIGEPRHATPAIITDTFREHARALNSYAATRGMPELRDAIAEWLTRRFGLPAGVVSGAHNVLPVAGTREGLFALAQAVVDRRGDATVLMPNPFYQIYEGAALLAGARPVYMNCDDANGFLPDLDAVSEADWRACRLVYLCSPGNPTGAVLPRGFYARLFELADRHDFVIAGDECYSELYRPGDDPPEGLLGAAHALGRTDFRRCVVFHSLSKRSNAPGLRSGFVAGDAEVLAKFLLYRTYHGCAMPLHTQHASIAAWGDEAHVADNRAAYGEKFDAVIDILRPVMDVERPAAGFYLWPRTPIDDERFARELFIRENVTVLPGRYLSRDTAAGNPGTNRVRIALVAELDACIDAAHRLRRYIESL